MCVMSSRAPQAGGPGSIGVRKGRREAPCPLVRITALFFRRHRYHKCESQVLRSSPSSVYNRRPLQQFRFDTLSMDQLAHSLTLPHLSLPYHILLMSPKARASAATDDSQRPAGGMSPNHIVISLLQPVIKKLGKRRDIANRAGQAHCARAIEQARDECVGMLRMLEMEEKQATKDAKQQMRDSMRIDPDRNVSLADFASASAIHASVPRQPRQFLPVPAFASAAPGTPAILDLPRGSGERAE